MANRHRGEIEARLGGQTYRLALTLGALAELEDAFGDEDLLALAKRFEAGRLSARDCIRIIAAGLRGAGHPVTDDAVAAMPCERGATGYVATVAALLTATFGADAAGAATSDEEARRSPSPFPGTR